METWTGERNHYQILNLLGEGLTGRVYSAIRSDSRGLSRQKVALKVLKNGCDLQFLRREFEVLTSLTSPFCASVLAWENLESGSALVLEYIEGISLSEILRRLNNLLPSELREEIVAQVQLGLKDLDAVGLNHGDLSPSNIMIDRAGGVRLIDFATSPLKSGIVGSPNYLSPERWKGSLPSIKSDLFALGCIEREMETGISGNEPAVIGNWLSSNPSQRKFTTKSSQIERRQVLAQLVLDLGSSGTQKIEILKPSARSSRLHVQPHFSPRRWLGVAACGIGIFVSSPAIGVNERSPESFGRLQVASRRWVEFKFREQSLGFSPLFIERFPVGEWWLDYRTKNERGRIKIHIAADRTLTLRDCEILKRDCLHDASLK